MKSYLKITLIILALAAMIGAVALAKSSRSNRGAWLGVVTQSVDYDLAEAFDLDIKYGVIVNELVEDSPAEEVGLEIDDIIVAVDGEEVTDYDDLVDLLDERKVGDQVTISLFRDGEKIDVSVELAERPRGRFKWDAGSNYSYGLGNWSHSSHAYIGVHVTDLSRQLGEFFGVDKGRGALIREVEEDSPADEAGLKAGDVIVAIDSDKIRDAGDVAEYIHDTEPGDNLSVTVMRDKVEVTLEVEVDESHGGSRFGGLFDTYYTPHVPSPSVDINLDALDALDDLDIRVPNLRSNFHSSFRAPLDRDRDKLKGEMEKLRQELKEMQKDLRKEMKTELDILREMIDN
ncbi:MAG: PDZ domain-containing protein [candidate division Zixibacteria bacterium]|nr:PDZ domain-containing protein [candidate division Zixibacteria bacterium]MDH3935772.1 PDZ domain-containing protein [candidate division Zixibacteria bacterium]MDH4033981.1 PDZ domain-containing protein [candidate division Zixibacteria bacterium]